MGCSQIWHIILRVIAPESMDFRSSKAEVIASEKVMILNFLILIPDHFF